MSVIRLSLSNTGRKFGEEAAALFHGNGGVWGFQMLSRHHCEGLAPDQLKPGQVKGRLRRLPNSVDGGDRPVEVLQPQLVLSVLVGEQAGFAQQGRVLQLSARQPLVNGLQAEQEHPVTEPTGEDAGQQETAGP